MRSKLILNLHGNNPIFSTIEIDMIRQLIFSRNPLVHSRFEPYWLTPLLKILVEMEPNHFMDTTRKNI